MADGVTAPSGSTIGVRHAGRGSNSALSPPSLAASTGCLVVMQQRFLRDLSVRPLVALLGIALWVATSFVVIQTSNAAPRGSLPFSENTSAATVEAGERNPRRFASTGVRLRRGQRDPHVEFVQLRRS